MAARLAIWPNTITPFKQLYAARADIIAMAWLPLLLMAAIDLSYYWVPSDAYSAYINFFYVDLPLGNVSSHPWLTSDYLHYTLRNISYTLFAIPLFRMIILGEKPVLRRFTVKRGGIMEDKRLFSVPYYFSFGKRECLYALLSVAVSLFFPCHQRLGKNHPGHAVYH